MPETTKPLLMVEFYSGSGVMAEAFRQRGWRVVTIDLFHPSDWQVDVLSLSREAILDRLGEEPDFLWFGTPCTGFSVASIGTHWGGGWRVYEPKTETARLGMRLAAKNKEIISWFPRAKWGIENPRGVLRKLPIYADLPRHTITFCQYGDDRMKPTDIWTNLNWRPRPICKNGDSCHVRAPTGAKTGTQGLKDAYDRAIYPREFCEEIAQTATVSLIEISE